MFKTKKIIVGILLLGMLAGGAGCGGKQTPQANQPPQKEQLAGMIQIKGSDSEVNVVQSMVEKFMAIEPNVAIAVTGGGSGAGIAALINKQTDIANSSRAMKGEEIDQAKANGVDPVGIVFAMDGLALIINETNPVSELTIDQVGAIYRGEITNWKEVGGPDLQISMYGRQSNSGTFVFFREFVVKGNYSDRKKEMNGTAQIVEGVKQDKAGIGYVGIGYAVEKGGEGKVVSGLKVLNLAAEAGKTAYSPLEMKNIVDGYYPLVRPLYQFINGKPTGAIKAFIEFELSEEGQAIVVENGFYPVTDEWQAHNENYLK
jgi:phosphate transport system substrate-binding protein